MIKKVIGHILLLIIVASLPVSLSCYAIDAAPVVIISKTTPVEQIDFGNGLFQRGLYQMAINEYKKFIELFPKSEYLNEAHFGIAESTFFLKSYNNAIPQYREYIKLFRNDRKAAVSTLRIGQVLYFLGKYDKALQHLTMVKQKDLDGKFKQLLFFYTGKAYKAKGEKNKALTYFEKAAGALNSSEYAVQAFLEIGDIYSGDASSGKAVEYYDKAFGATTSGKVQSLALHKKAETQFSSGEYSVAANTFKQVLESKPDDDIFLNALANLLLSLFNIGEYDDLIREYQNNKGLISDDEKFLDIQYITACAYFVLSRFEESLAVIDKLLSFDWLKGESKRKVLIKKTELYLKSKRYDEVLELVNTELSGIKEDADYIVFIKAESYYVLKKFDEALDEYEKIIKDFPGSEFYDHALHGKAYSQKALGQNEAASVSLVEYFYKGKHPDKRRGALYTAVALETRLKFTKKAIKHSKLFLSTFKQNELREKVLFRLGLLHFDLKEYVNAAATFKEFIDSYEKSSRLQEAYFQLAYNLQLSEKTDEAIIYYEKITPGKNPKMFYSALKNMALIYINEGDDDKAVKMFDRIVSDYKDHDLGIEVYLWLARYYLSEEDFKNVLRVLDQGKSKKGFGEHIKEVGYFKGEAYRGIKKYRKAITNYDIALSTEGEDIFRGASLIGKGLCLSATREYEKGKSVFENAILESPEDNTITMRARFEMANIAKHQKKLKEAAKMYMFVSILYNDDQYCPEALFEAGTIFEALEKKDEAEKVYREIVEMYSKNKLKEKAIERLKVLNEE